MRYLSVCSGIEAATVAWHPLGFEPVGFSEIEPFPCAVLAHHYPQVTNFGDMTKYKEWNLNGTIDLLIGGTPCQSFSVAGLRKGLEDPRGNLALTYVGILDKFRPKWFIWENVPGVLSSSGGRDFGAFLGAVGELGYGWAYRVLDAQYFGVAQRRRRVFVVGCFGDWESPAKVLFEPESMSRDIKPRRTKRESVTGYVESSFGAYREDVIAGTTKASGGVLSGGSETFVHAHVADKCPTITNSGAGFSRVGNGTTEHETYIAVQAYRKSRRAQSNTDFETWVDDGKANTINTFDLGDVRTTHAIAFEPGIAKREGGESRFTEEITSTLRSDMGDNQVAVAFTSEQTPKVNYDQAHTLTQTNYKHNQCVAYPIHDSATRFQGGGSTRNNDGKGNGFGIGENGAPMNTLDTVSRHAVAHTFKIRGGCEGGGKGYLGQDEKTYTISATQDQQLYANMAVRRLTPIECERLQGFPDRYTDIKPKGKDTPDGPRYKALGNSMAVPVIYWLGKRIKEMK